MKLIVDFAGVTQIQELYRYFPVDGVTTNPTILAREGKNPYEVLTAIRECIGDDTDLHVQVISDKAETMLEEAKRIRSVLGSNTYIKIPVTREGLRAIRMMKKNNYMVTATAIYNALQGYLAGLAEADFAAPYINRIDNLGADGVQVAKDIHDIFRSGNMPTQVLAASFKNSQQVLELAKYGIAAATVSPDVIEGMLRIDAAQGAVGVFRKDFEKLCGPGKTMKDC
ncbi:transaldolase family protein [Oscillospiraceae bacterium MB08-C2-2]|nr:transaldolase family protein [Oscillospiraceae bacterium MB08-C2-2]